jgi:hypothetical protein
MGASIGRIARESRDRDDDFGTHGSTGARREMLQRVVR